jgi:hypothetical protein
MTRSSFVFPAVALALALAAVGPGARAQGAHLLAGAAAESITPFTVIPSVTTAVDPNSNAAASNPDGQPGGLWETFQPELGFASAGQVTVSGLWGEQYTDQNANRRYDDGEPFVDDPVNTRLDPDSANKYDGIYLAGFGEDRIPRGVFDPIWARALYVRDPASGLAYAHASIDVLGWFSDWNDRIVGLARQLDPSIDLDYLIVSHTHDHEAPDTHVGIWGTDLLHDGTYPKYERYIEAKIAQAVVAAAATAVPARFKFASIRPGTPFTTLNENAEDLTGLQSRNSCRTPWVFDDEVRVVQVAGDPAEGAPSGDTIATLVNWGTHVESLEGGNQYLSSDFVHTERATVEQALGGIEIHVQGAQGAGEVVGDSCTRRWQRTTFDGETYPVDGGGDPTVLAEAGGQLVNNIGARDRTYALGRVVGSAAVAAANAASFDPTATAIEGFTARDVFVPVNNEGLSALGAIGVIDKPAYVGGVSVAKEAFGRAGLFANPPTGVDTRTTVYAWKIGGASFVTAPGELFPEIYYGLATHNRTVAGTAADHFDYTSPNPAATACSTRAFSYDAPYGADTGRPYEPGIREAQIKRYGTTHNYLFGYTPDLLGYIVPGYDFSWYATPPAEGVGLGSIIGEAPDPCSGIPADLAYSAAGYGHHYQETNSAGSMLAPAYACSVWEMLGLNPARADEGNGACYEWHAWKTGGLAHLGVEPAVCDFTGEFASVEDCVRHY